MSCPLSPLTAGMWQHSCSILAADMKGFRLNSDLHVSFLTSHNHRSEI